MEDNKQSSVSGKTNSQDTGISGKDKPKIKGRLDLEPQDQTAKTHDPFTSKFEHFSSKESSNIHTQVSKNPKNSSQCNNSSIIELNDEEIKYIDKFHGNFNYEESEQVYQFFEFVIAFIHERIYDIHINP